MSTTNRYTTLLALAASAVLLSSCAGGSNGSSSALDVDLQLEGSYNMQDRENLQEGDDLTLGIDEFSEQQNAFNADMTSYTRTFWQYYNPQLSTYTGDGEFVPNADYLTDVEEEVVDGKTQVTYTINPDAKYNDGTEIDWKVFEHTWKFNNGEMDELNIHSTEGFDKIESITPGENDKQVVVKFKQAYPWWQDTFSSLLPPQVDSAEKFNEAYVNQLHPEWGAGPYTVDSVDFGAGTATFTENDKWWGDKPFIKKITYRQMESQASINAFKAGEIDATGVASKERLATIQDMDNIEIRAAMRPANVLFVLNSDAPGLDDIKVREAFMTAIDRDQLASIRFNDLDYEEDLPGSFTLYQTQEGYQDSFGELISFDPEKAKQLLDDAGWAPGADGTREKDGQPLALRYVLTGDDPGIKAEASATQKMLADVGIKLDIEERPSADFSKIVTKRDFDIFPMAFASSSPLGVASFNQIYASDSELNKSGTGTPEMDKKIEELGQIADSDEQTQKANELEKEALSTFGIMPLMNGPDMVATNPKLANFGAKSLGSVEVENVGYVKE